MSRSRKKNGIIKDRGSMRKLYNKKFRRVNNQRIRMGKDPYLMKELINPWDVCDWIYIWRGDDYEMKYFNDTYRLSSYFKEFEKYKRGYFKK